METGTMHTGAPAGADGPADGMRAPGGRPPAEPVRPAPARFGVAGYSAGDERHVRRRLGSRRDARRRIGRERAADRLAQGLGWFSIALGAAELVAAEEMARWLGLRDRAGVLRACGLREIVNGGAVLAPRRTSSRSPWLWARVVGDGVDLALLADGLDQRGAKRGRILGAMIAVGAITALDVVSAVSTGRVRSPGR